MIKICKHFKKAIRELLKEFDGGPSNELEYLEVAPTSPSIFMDEIDLECAISFAKATHIDPAICCAIMELSGLMKDRYDRRTTGER
jgi:hypothetical protein